MHGQNSGEGVGGLWRSPTSFKDILERDLPAISGVTGGVQTDTLPTDVSGTV
jgi:hypothetical protein